MRSWHPISPAVLDRKRLLGEHLELHTIYSVIVNNRKGYSQHPETKRWENFVPALILRHNAVVAEMERRGYQHHSPLPIPTEQVNWPDLIEPLEVMIAKLNLKLKGASK